MKTVSPSNFNGSLADALSSIESRTLNPLKLTKVRDVGYNQVKAMVDNFYGCDVDGRLLDANRALYFKDNAGVSVPV